jgi:hypothetical protein
MKLFVPRAEGPEQANAVEMGARQQLGGVLGASFDDRWVFWLRHKHNGRQCEARVGETYQPIGEDVLLILHEPTRQVYHICTATRGVVGGQSVLVGKREVEDDEDFE